MTYQEQIQQALNDKELKQYSFLNKAILTAGLLQSEVFSLIIIAMLVVGGIAIIGIFSDFFLFLGITSVAGIFIFFSFRKEVAKRKTFRGLFYTYSVNFFKTAPKRYYGAINLQKNKKDE
jgi:hypothetical protein